MFAQVTPVALPMLTLPVTLIKPAVIKFPPVMLPVAITVTLLIVLVAATLAVFTLPLNVPVVPECVVPCTLPLVILPVTASDVNVPTLVMLGCAAVVNVPTMLVPLKLPAVTLPVIVANVSTVTLPYIRVPELSLAIVLYLSRVKARLEQQTHCSC